MDPNALVPGIGSRKTLVFCFAIITIGLVLRLVWPADMEWKGDEQEMYASAHSVARSGTWPAAGMKSGGGSNNCFKNSTFVFLTLAINLFL